MRMMDDGDGWITEIRMDETENGMDEYPDIIAQQSLTPLC